MAIVAIVTVSVSSRHDGPEITLSDKFRVLFQFHGWEEVACVVLIPQSDADLAEVAHIQPFGPQPGCQDG
jgi:hypothetical protein